MVILTARVIANLEMDDIRIGAIQPWWWLFFPLWEGEADRAGLTVCVGFSVLRLVLVSRLVSRHHRRMWLPWQHHVGSTQCSLCSFYSSQPTQSLLPIMYSKQCFLCLMFVLCPCGSCCCEYAFRKLLFFFLCFGLSCLRQVPSSAQSQTGVCTAVVRFRHRWDKCHCNSV